MRKIFSLIIILCCFMSVCFASSKEEAIRIHEQYMVPLDGIYTTQFKEDLDSAENRYSGLSDDEAVSKFQELIQTKYIDRVVALKEGLANEKIENKDVINMVKDLDKSYDTLIDFFSLFLNIKHFKDRDYWTVTQPMIGLFNQDYNATLVYYNSYSLIVDGKSIHNLSLSSYNKIFIDDNYSTVASYFGMPGNLESSTSTNNQRIDIYTWSEGSKFVRITFINNHVQSMEQRGL